MHQLCPCGGCTTSLWICNGFQRPIAYKHQWPAVKHAEKRAITINEHQRIIAREKNPERRPFYECRWHIDGSEGDIAAFHAEDIDWTDRTIAFRRKKTKTPALISFGEELAEVLKASPTTGALFPSLAKAAVERPR